jgi:hypothetical protein
MIVSHEREFIFIHVQRTAGTSIEKSICEELNISKWEGFIGEPRHVALDSETKLDDVYFNEQRKKLEGKKHITAEELRHLIGKETWNSYFTFSFVRNPWDRYLSSYMKKRKEAPNKIRKLWPKSKLLLNIAMLYKIGFLKWKTKSQLDYLTDNEGNIIVDFIGKFENLHEDFSTVCSRIGVDASLGDNDDSTSHKHYRKYYYGITKKVIKKHVSKEVDLFDYTF